MGIPVVVATNGFGIPVKAVADNAPHMTVATNGFGIPIVISDRGIPFVVSGLAPSSSDALLLENGDFLLLESGDKLLLEA